MTHLVKMVHADFIGVPKQAQKCFEYERFVCTLWTLLYYVLILNYVLLIVNVTNRPSYKQLLNCRAKTLVNID